MWISAVLVLLAMGAIWGLTALIAIAVNHAGPFLDTEDDYWVEQESVSRAVAAPCREVATAARDVRLFAGPEAGAEDLLGLAGAMREVVTAVDAASPDRDARAWRADWLLITDRLEAHARSLSTEGSRSFSLLDEQGADLAERVGYGGPDSCHLPTVLMVLDDELRGGDPYGL